MKREKTHINYYAETQNIQHFWTRLVLLFEIIIFSAILYRQLVMGKPFGPYPVTNSGLIILILLLLSPVVILFFIKVKITVNQKGIYYEMVPLDLFKHKITRRQLKNFSIETRNPKNGNSITGIKLELKNDKSLFLPSKKPKALFRAIQKMQNDA